MAKGTTKTAVKSAKPTNKAAAAPAPEAVESVTPAIPPEFTIGVVTKFKGYAELGENDEPIFNEGETVTITEIREDTQEIVIESEDKERNDSVFADELELPESVAEAPTKKKATKTAAAAPKAKVSTKKATASAPVEEAQEAPRRGRPKKAATVAPPIAQPKNAVTPVKLYATPTVQQVMSEGDATEAAVALIETYEETYFTLGGVLTHIYYNETYKEDDERYAGKGGWALYLEEKLGLSYRRTMMLIEIYKTFSEKDIDEKALSRIGWTKVHSLTKYLTPENATELLAYAEEHSREDLDEYIKTTYGSSSDGAGTGQPMGERVKKVSFKFSVLDTESDMCRDALEAAKQMYETGEEVGPAFAAICNDWYTLVGGNDVTLEQAIERVQAQFSVVLTVADDEAAA